MLTYDDATAMTGALLTSSDASAVGEVVDVYIDTDTRRPEWALVLVPLSGREQRFVPLLRAQWISGAAHVPYTAAQVHDAPEVHINGELSPQQEAQLYHHYGLDYEHRTTLGSHTSGSTSTT